MKKLMILVVVLTAIVLTSCSDADTASYNLSKAAEQFEVYRRVVFINGITDSYILQIEGYCSVDVENGRLAVTIKTGDGKYLKHYLGLSDNVTYLSEQIDASSVSTQHYRVIFKPSVIVPNVDLE
jgi:hypothetical protein